MQYADPPVSPPEVARPPDVAAPAVLVSTGGGESLAGAQGTSKIMIVDDELINIKLCRKFLKAGGYTNFIATTEATQAMD